MKTELKSFVADDDQVKSFVPDEPESPMPALPAIQVPQTRADFEAEANWPAEMSRISDASGVDPGSLVEINEHLRRSLPDTPATQRMPLVQDVVNAVKESPEDIYIGTMKFSAGILSAIKRRAMLFSGSIMNTEAGKSAFEMVRPTAQESPDPLMEQIFGRPRPGPGALAGEALGLVTRLPDAGQMALNYRAKQLADAQDKVTIRTAPATRILRGFNQGVAPSLALGTAAAVITGDPSIALVLMGESSGGSEFEEELAKGRSPFTANVLADLNEAAEIGGESLVFPKFIKGLTEGIPLANALKLLAENAGQEGVTGFNQAFFPAFVEAREQGMSIAEATKYAAEKGFAAVPENAAYGAMGGAVMDAATLPATVFESVASKREALKRAMEAVNAPDKAKGEAPPAGQVTPPAVAAPDTTPAAETPETAAEPAEEEVKYPVAGDEVDGLKVRSGPVPDTESIADNLNDYRVIEGVREIPLDAFNGDFGEATRETEEEKSRVRELAGQILESGEVAPLIVVEDADGLYVLEGGYRADALADLGQKSLPALFVRDTESLAAKAAKTSTGPEGRKAVQGGATQAASALPAILEHAQLEPQTPVSQGAGVRGQQLQILLADGSQHTATSLMGLLQTADPGAGTPVEIDWGIVLAWRNLGETDWWRTRRGEVLYQKMKAQTAAGTAPPAPGADNRVISYQLRPVRKGPQRPRKGEIGPPGPSGATVEAITADHEEPSLTSARQEWLNRNRRSMGMDGVNSKERRRWGQVLAQAWEQKIPEGALRLANEIVAKPRAFSDVETAGLVIRMRELENEHEGIMQRIAPSKDQVEIADLAARAATIEAEYDVISQALHMSGTEKGRALAAQKLTINENFSPVSVKARAKAAKGAELTAKENQKIEELVKALAEREDRVNQLDAELRKIKAAQMLSRLKLTSRLVTMTMQEKVAEQQSAAEKVRKLMLAGC